MSTAIEVNNLSKVYHLGEVGTGTLSRDIERWWALLRGKEDPFLKIGEKNDKTTKSKSNVVYSLKDINLDIKQGETVGIIGRNGAGKSTLLKVLSRVTSPTNGNIKLNGRVASLLEVGTGFHPELTGRENIFLNGAILGMRKKEVARKLDEIVSFSGIERYLDTPVKRYSSGMYVRLAFAVAAHLDSEILIVDEVLAVGDIEFQNKCLGKMNDISENSGRTILFVSHNMGAIKKLCKKTLVLKDGELVFEGGVQEGISHYLQTTLESEGETSLSHVLNNPDLDTEIMWKDIRIIQSGVYTSEIHNDEDFHIEFTYQVKNDTIGFRALIAIYTIEELCIFRSFFDEGNYWGTEMKAGTYTSKVTIPANVLIEGKYLLHVQATKIGVRDFHRAEMFFSVFQTGHINRITYPENYRGLITLPLQWETNPA